MSTPPEITLSSSGEAIDTPINPSIQLPSPVASTPGSSFSPKSPTSPKRHPHFPADHALTLPMPSTRANSNPDIEPITRGSHAPSLMTSRPSTRKRPASAGTDTALKINLTHIPKNIFNTVKSAVEILSHSRIFGTKERENVNVWVGTWNMNGRIPPQDCNPFFPAEYQDLKPDIIAIGTQECLRPLAQALLITSKSVWEAHIEKVLGPLGYALLKYTDLGGVHLGVFYRPDSPYAFELKGSGKLATGVGGVVANKGGVAISINCWSKKRGRNTLCTFAFVACHFVAHQQYVAERNANFARINKELIFSGKDLGFEGGLISSTFDYIFWFGDLNYRLLAPVNATTLRQAAQTGIYDALVEMDQLHLEKRAGRVFPEFEEGAISFPPTFKFLVPGVSNKKDNDKTALILNIESPPNSPGILSGNAFLYPDGVENDGNLSPDNTPSNFPSPTFYDPIRAPSYTDRILYKSNVRGAGTNPGDSLTNKKAIRCIKYGASMDIVCSDHKPVWGLYEANLEDVQKRAGPTPLSFVAAADTIIHLRRKSKADANMRQGKTSKSFMPSCGSGKPSLWNCCYVSNRVSPEEYLEPETKDILLT